MATTPTYDAATRMAVGITWIAPPEPETPPRIPGLRTAMDRAEQFYAQTIHSSRVVTAIAFFVTAALAVGNQNGSPTPMLAFLGIALFSAASGQLLARYRFRHEIVAAARKANLSAQDARSFATDMFAEWSAANHSAMVAKSTK